MVLLSLIIQLHLSSVNIDQKLDDFQTGIIKVPLNSSCTKCFNTFGISFTGETKRLFSFLYSFENALTSFVPGQENFEVNHLTVYFMYLQNDQL